MHKTDQSIKQAHHNDHCFGQSALVNCLALSNFFFYFTDLTSSTW